MTQELEGKRRKDCNNAKEVINIDRAIGICFDLVIEADVENIEIEDLGPIEDFRRDRRF
ncbi:hypothetical protein [Orenia marismortui]|uniref:Uncharacterized protein n=1 Tax=Orenia marismortui TaxID=46469 RepID=A0A4R8HAK5_9FIRM|nr:hypothetical protein [Orenia marismortui]TDX52492.1 hypothetical protein C7959_10655 [Orenia marismortui]